jgi:N2-acetyl-L-2,4-diaminobutanoate deacetylase
MRFADKAQEARCFAARDAFAAPYSMTMREIDAVGMYDTAAEDLGKVFVTTELGGGGTATAASVAIARRGVSNFLKHAGILAGVIETHPTVRLDMPSGDCFTFSETEGMAEFLVDLGEPVRSGDVLVRVHVVGKLGGAPTEYRARMDGILVARHVSGLTAPGDCLAVVAAPA